MGLRSNVICDIIYKVKLYEEIDMNKKALITGASRGIGKAIASKLAKEGFDLVLTCSNNIDMLRNMAFDLSGRYNIRCEAYKCDCSDYTQVDKLFVDSSDFDVVVNNAGIAYIGLLQDMSVEEWNRVVNTNLSSVFYTCRNAIEYMVSKKKGRIINISSMWGEVGASMEVAYSTTKGGINAFTKALAKELAPCNITVNAVACGVIDTDMNACFDADERTELEESIPVGRFGRTEEVAEVVLDCFNVINLPGVYHI